MLKRCILAVIAIVCCAVFAMARDTISHDPSILPAAAQNVVNKNFKAKISFIKIDKKWGHVDDYEVVLTDGSEISFDSKGNWESVEVACNHNVPGAFILPGIAEYVKKNHKGVNIVGIERERGGFDVELANGIDMKFDKTGNFLRYDD